MNISDSDIEKIKMITVSAQVNDLVALLSNIDKDNLMTSINSVKPENRNSVTYKLLLHALEFYEHIENELSDQRSVENLDDTQFNFSFGE